MLIILIQPKSKPNQLRLPRDRSFYFIDFFLFYLRKLKLLVTEKPLFLNFISFLIHSHFTSFHCKIVRRSHQPSAIVSSSFILINIVAVTSLLCLFVKTLFVLCLLMVVGFFSTINNRRRRSAEKSIIVVVFDFSYMCKKYIDLKKSDLRRNLHFFLLFK